MSVLSCAFLHLCSLVRLLTQKSSGALLELGHSAIIIQSLRISVVPILPPHSSCPSFGLICGWTLAKLLLVQCLALYDRLSKRA